MSDEDLMREFEGSILKQLSDFEEQLVKIRVVTNISKEECEKLSKEFLALGNGLGQATVLAENYLREKLRG